MVKNKNDRSGEYLNAGAVLSASVDSIFIALVVYLSSCGVYADNNIMLHPLAQFSDFARNLSVGLLFIIIFINFLKNYSSIKFRMKNIDRALMYLWLLQFVFLLKLLLFGNYKIFFEGIFILTVQFLVFCLYLAESEVKSAYYNYKFIDRIVDSGVVFASLFALTNLVLYIFFHERSVTFASERFFGNMINPQHFMMTSVLSMPFILFKSKEWHHKRIYNYFLFSIVAIIFFLVFQTGSRSGLLVLIVMLGIFYRDEKKNKLFVALFLSAIVFIYLVYSDYYLSIKNKFYGSFIDGRTDTRSYVYQRELNEFLEYPLAGVPPSVDGRLLFSETAWLSIASNAGIVGVVLGLLLLYSLIHIIFRLFTLKLNDPTLRVRRNMFLSGISGIMLLSLFESVFLGLYTAMTMLCIIYISCAATFIRTNTGTRRYRLR